MAFTADSVAEFLQQMPAPVPFLERVWEVTGCLEVLLAASRLGALQGLVFHPCRTEAARQVKTW